jgi:hypothetical protein
LGSGGVDVAIVSRALEKLWCGSLSHRHIGKKKCSSHWVAHPLDTFYILYHYNSLPVLLSSQRSNTAPRKPWDAPFGDGSITCTDGWTLIAPVWGLKMHNCMSVNLVPGSTSLTGAFSIVMPRRLTSRRAVLMGSPNLGGLKFYYSLNFDPNKNPS